MGESAALALRPGPGVVERVVVIREPAAPASAVAPAPKVANAEPASAPEHAPMLGGNPLEPVWGDPSRAIWPSRWATVAEARLTSDLALALALDLPAEPAARPFPDASPTPSAPSPPASAGELRRQLWQKLLPPGDRS